MDKFESMISRTGAACHSFLDFYQLEDAGSDVDHHTGRLAGYPYLCMQVVTFNQPSPIEVYVHTIALS